MKNTFVVSCPIDTYSGYGSRSRDFVKALIEMDKYNVKILSQRWGNCSWGFLDEHENEWGFLKSHIIPQLQEQPDIWCQISVPNEFQKVGKYNIGLTAGIETTICAPEWIEGINRMDLNMVSSKHSKKVFESTQYEKKDNNGNVVGVLKCEKPIHVLMEGANLDIYKPLSRKDIKYKDLFNDINSIPEDFAFLFVGHWMQGDIGEDRKNVGLLLKVFYEMFKNKKNPPALILKSCVVNASYVGRKEILKRINIVRNSVVANKLPNVYLIHGDFSDSEINELYNHPKVKSMISLTKGEGFGRPLLEFSLVNKPVIATSWSGHIDFLNPEFTALINGTTKPIHKSAQIKNMLVKGSQWFSPDHQSTANLITDVYKNYKEWKVRAKRQGYYSRTNFSFEKMKEILREILNHNIPDIAKQVTLNLPKLKKSKASNTPKLNLPKLKKV
jgi:glycosyltransferase involved in cell wall biosynthesis